jgi:beta-lactamase regulating signal transducer with metallopeptidase domain
MISLLIEAALRTLLVALAVAGGLRLLRVSNVLAQKRTWGLVLAAALLMPLLMRWQWLTASAPIRVPMQTWAQLADFRPAGAASPNSTSPATTPLGAPRTFRLAPQPTENSVAPAAVRSGELVPAVVPQSTTIMPQPLALAWLLYLGVGAVLLARLLYGICAAMRLWSTAEPVCLALEDDLSMGLCLRSSPRIASPVAVASGVVLPADYAQWDRQKLRIVLAHERSHLRQGDFYLQTLAGLHAALFWFSPLAWWLKRKLTDLGEAVSDRAGLEVAGSRSSYAQILLEFAALPRPTLIGVAMARRSRLSHRIERFLNEPNFRLAFAGSRRSMVLAVLLVPLAFIAFTAFVRVEAAGQAPLQPAPQIQPIAPIPAEPPAAENPSGPASPAGPPSTAVPAGAPLPPPLPPLPPPPSLSAGEGSSQDSVRKHSHAENKYSFMYSNNGDSYALVRGPGNAISYTGDWNQDTGAAIEKARKLAHGDFLWFTRNGKSYLLDDPVAVAKIEAMYQPMEALGKKQEELGHQQHELGTQQEELGRKMSEAGIPTPDMSKEIADLAKQMAKLKAMQGKTMTVEEWADLESKLGNLQGRLGAIQGEIGARQGALGGEMGKLGSLQGELGAQQGRLGAEQGRIAGESGLKVKAIIDEALSNGKARPVE